ncbi:putative RNA-binding protein 28-like [Homarus americanus]|uniref:Putative RNA-binding protein 28-like n=1 Tax=Homarus americanus TaxID=6706 RepID=A0A8J5MYZ8_HOMAM|nr:putative RNA-binding protein 28-like [Homarus americanus]
MVMETVTGLGPLLLNPLSFLPHLLISEKQQDEIFVRFVSLDAALNAVMKLNGLVVQQRRINAEVARSHWRNTNKQTVMHEGFDGDDSKDEETNSSLSMDDINTTIIQICHRQWQQHRRRHRDTDLPSFGRIMGMLAKLPTSEDEESETEVES